jgi:hypothetical protein
VYLKKRKPIIEVDPIMVRMKKSRYSEIPFASRMPARRFPITWAHWKIPKNFMKLLNA